MSARIIIVGLLAAAGMAVAGCSVTTSTPSSHEGSSPPPAAVSAAPPVPTAPGSPSRVSSSTAPAESSDVTMYQPSSVVTSSSHYTLLHTKDGVKAVTAFYDKQFTDGGWTIISKTASSFSGNFTVRKSGQGVTVAISWWLGGSSISISTY